jgi:CheY-like chemotaxis protein
MTQLLSRILGEQITLRLHAGEGLWRIIADPTQLETAVLNLAVNARDAMPKGGTLSIEIANAHLDSEYAGRQVEVAPGDYVEIAVSDTGTGMPPEVIARAFDPFFTTKDAGRGTGLGLSMVYGFIKQSGGHIKIYSEPGHGSTIKLWLPRAAQAVDEDEASSSTQPQPAPRGKETILIVEDNADIRKVVISQIESLGYRTLAAGNAQDALEILEKNDGIDLLFTDVVMPGGKDGRALADEAVLLRPGLKVLFTSGFTQAGNGSHGGEPLKAPLISKPYRKQQLAETLRKVFSA